MAKRLVIKVGTKVLSSLDGTLDRAVIKHLVAQIISIKKGGAEVVLVTSGAMAAGRGLITLKGKEKIAQRQVFAAVGQVELMRIYSDFFSEHKELCAQVLATKEDFRDKAHYLNMQTCFENLLGSNVVPIVNENDVVATTELLFTDNDELAGLVASQINADAVVILTSVDGFLSGDPSDANSRVISLIDFHALDECEKYIAPEKTAFGRGGMLTKFHIAKKLALQGVTVYFANGKKRNVLTDVLSGKPVGTKFIPREKSSALKRRIAYSEGLCKGTVCVNKGAEDLLLSKTKIMSLLPVGITNVEGDFAKGDIVEIRGGKKTKLGFGIAEYGADTAKELMGKKK